MVLPNGQKVFCQRAEEAQLMYQEVQGYVDHGMQLKAGDTILDVGANIGLFSIWAYNQCLGDAQIYAFEPIPQIYYLLEANFAQFQDDKFRALPYGLGAERTSTEFVFYPNASFASTAFPDSKMEDRVLTATLMIRNLADLPKPLPALRLLPVFIQKGIIRLLAFYINRRKEVRAQIQPLSEVIDQYGIEKIDFMKVDAEKSEWEVFKGIRNEHWPLIRQLFVEVHNREDRLDQIQQLLKEKGFSKVVTGQDDFFKGTDIYAIYAMR